LEKTKNDDFTLIFDHSDDIAPELAKRYLESKGCIVYPPIAFRTTGANVSRWTTFVENVENSLKGETINKVN
jgi:hypothetical protein